MHQTRHIGGFPPRLETSRGAPALAHLGCAALVMVCGPPLGGCKATVQEIRGKTSFGPEFRNQGNSRHETRYDARENLDVKWDNGWTTGLTYRNRDVDNGSGDNEHLFLFEVGYPIWKAAKRPEKTTERIDQLETELAELRAQVAAGSTRLAAPSVAATGTQP